MSTTQTRHAPTDVFRVSSDAARDAEDDQHTSGGIRDALSALAARAELVLAVQKSTAEALAERLQHERNIGIVIGLIMAEYGVGDTSAAQILRILAGEAKVTEPEMACQILAMRTA